jgi:hypothetical protein
MAVGFAVGTYWTVGGVVWNPVDEVAHFGYIESLARGDGVPTVGVDLISDDALASFKQSPTLLFRSYPYQESATDENWGGTRHQYEAVHGPTYYVAMVPAYWIGAPFGTIGSLYAIRFATIALVLLAVPLTWMLARRLFPDRPVIWLLAPALLVTVNSLSPGQVSNDAMVMVLSITTILVFLRALDGWGQRRDWVPAVGAGVLFGLTIVTKMTSLVLIPFLALAFLAWVVTQRPKVVGVLRFVALVAGGAIAAFAPWLAWNLRTYRSTSAATVVESITGASLPESQLGLGAIWQHATVARPGVWVNQILTPSGYETVWEVALLASLVLGGVALVVRRRWRDLSVLLWCGSALPLAFASMEVIVFVLFGGTGGPMGRHLIAALAPTMVMIAAAAVFVVGSRWAPPLVASLVALTLVFQVTIARTFVDDVYLRAAVDDIYAPVRYQDWSDGTRDDVAAITIDATCPVQVIGLGFLDPTLGTEPGHVPSTLVVRSAAGETPAIASGTVYDIPTYRLPETVTGLLTIDLPPGSIMRSTADDLEPGIAFDTGGGDPVATAFCVEDSADTAESKAFAIIFPSGHPEWISLGMIRNVPAVFAGAAVLVALGLAAVALRSQIRARAGASRPSGPSRAPGASAGSAAPPGG